MFELSSKSKLMQKFVEFRDFEEAGSFEVWAHINCYISSIFIIYLDIKELH